MELTHLLLAMHKFMQAPVCIQKHVIYKGLSLVEFPLHPMRKALPVSSLCKRK